MKRLAVFGLMLTVAFSASGCYGPMNLSRGFDDWANQTYVDSPWLGQVLLYVGVIPLAYTIAVTIDYAVLNVLDFWGQSAFRGTGTPYVHRNPAVPEPR